MKRERRVDLSKAALSRHCCLCGHLASINLRGPSEELGRTFLKLSTLKTEEEMFIHLLWFPLVEVCSVEQNSLILPCTWISRAQRLRRASNEAEAENCQDGNLRKELSDCPCQQLTASVQLKTKDGLRRESMGVTVRRSRDKHTNKEENQDNVLG